MSLSRRSLLRLMDANTPWERRLVVEPFFKDSVGAIAVSASLDFHLGNRFVILQSRRAVYHDPLIGDPKKDVGAKELFVPMGQEFSLHPGQIVLGTTLEWFRFPNNLLAYVTGRSIWGRRGLQIVTASAVHPGSSGTITLEMANLGDVGLRLKPGVAIGQLFFHLVEEVDESELKDIRKSTFSLTLRPGLGRYRQTLVERLLLEPEPADKKYSPTLGSTG
jgi:dCTP deaminase